MPSVGGHCAAEQHAAWAVSAGLSSFPCELTASDSGPSAEVIIVLLKLEIRIYKSALRAGPRVYTCPLRAVHLIPPFKLPLIPFTHSYKSNA